jgi:hypothetical protein
MQLATKALGILLAIAGLGGTFLSLLALMDPAGAQHSNDADPFGAPPGTTQILFSSAVSLLMLCIGAWLFFRRRPS